LRARQDLGMEEGSTEPVWVAGNALLLEEAIANLIDNALRYAGQGASITVAVRTQAGQAVLSVEDDGPGLSEPDRQRVFGRFVRATEAGSGCGLGLAIVREIVERHGGQVSLEPVEPHGLRAELRLAQAPAPVPSRQG
jgi:two-component system sensor histidine kinase TctE